MMSLESLTPQLEKALTLENKRKALQQVSAVLQNKVPHFTWVGFYFMNENGQTLHLGPYTGLPTEHKVIPYGKGICGQVAVSAKTYISDNVYEEDNYIACSIEVLSELVLPIFDKDNKLIAQLDIDSNQKAAFGKKDQVYLSELCTKLGKEISDQLSYEDFVSK